MSAQVAWFDGGALNTFKFMFSAAPCNAFRFADTSPHAQGAHKRRRPLWDVDGSTELGKKKRRLRLTLITSKLGKPFSSPASHVADHGVKKVTEFRGGEGCILEKADLRKLALSNCVKRRVDDMRAGTERARAMLLASPVLSTAAAQSMPTHSQLMCQMAVRDVSAVKPRTPETAPAMPPSPLGQNNYDALDLEDEEEYGAMYGSDEDEDIGSSSPYGPINTRNTSVEGENYDFLDEMDGISHDDLGTSFELGERRWWA